MIISEGKAKELQGEPATIPLHRHMRSLNYILPVQGCSHSSGPVFPLSCVHVHTHRGYDVSAHRKLQCAQKIIFQKVTIYLCCKLYNTIIKQHKLISCLFFIISFI